MSSYSYDQPRSLSYERVPESLAQCTTSHEKIALLQEVDSREGLPTLQRDTDLLEGYTRSERFQTVVNVFYDHGMLECYDLPHGNGKRRSGAAGRHSAYDMF